MAGQLVKVSAADVQAQMSGAPYRTVRMGAVSIREVSGGYSVRAATTARRLPGGRLQQGERVTRVYGTQEQVAAVVTAQAHSQAALASGHHHHGHKAITSKHGH